MIIIISNPTSVKEEHVIINQLFDEGLEFFHLRKQEYSIREQCLLLERIDVKYRSKISLHQHHEIADMFGIERFHYPEEYRKRLNEVVINEHKEKKNLLSTSIHELKESENISHFDYVFFGPVFNSISKPNYNSTLKKDFKIPALRKTKMIAIGGIDSQKIKKAKEYGFDGIAVLGNIWTEPEEALNNFKSLKKEWEN
jgi:thiamine-phosphate pyrophosphorylase